MTPFALRALFLLASASIGYQISRIREEDVLWGMLFGIAVALIIIAVEVLLSKRPIQSISAIVFGLITGSLLAIILYNIFELTDVDALSSLILGPGASTRTLKLIVLLSLTVMCCYIFTMIIYKTRDRFRFIIPYVEFQKEERGSRPIIIDTSAVIDGRLSDLCETGLFDTTMIVPKFVLQELQHVADSADRLRRNRGRRGLEMLQKLQRDDRLAIQIHDGRSARGNTVDSKLVSLAGQLQARILTCDYNLAKFAELQNVETINLNDISNALRPTVLAGEEIMIKVIRQGDEQGQGVGYLPDGTMVVIEGGKNKIDQTIPIVITSTLQTSAGRMVFGRIRSEHPAQQSPQKNDGKERGEREAST